MNILRKQVSESDLIQEYLKILNGVLQLSEREVEVFSFLLKVDSTGPINNINSKQIRANLMKELGMSESNLSRYLSSLKERGILVRGEIGKWVINDMIRPIVKDGIFELKFILNVIPGNNTEGLSS